MPKTTRRSRKHHTQRKWFWVQLKNIMICLKMNIKRTSIPSHSNIFQLKRLRIFSERISSRVITYSGNYSYAMMAIARAFCLATVFMHDSIRDKIRSTVNRSRNLIALFRQNCAKWHEHDLSMKLNLKLIYGRSHFYWFFLKWDCNKFT